MKIKLLGAHNCETSDHRHTCLVIDGVLALDAGSLTAGLSLEEQKKLIAVLLSHQHYDHIRDVVALGTNLFHSRISQDIYSTVQVMKMLREHLFTSGMYRNLEEVPEENPVFRLNVIEPFSTFQAAGYKITALPVKHSVFTTGFYVVPPEGKSVFYTADTGPGLAECWEKISPQLLIIEVTETNKSEQFFRKAGHLTPSLLKEELVTFRKMKGYLPEVVAVHMSPEMEDGIKRELAAVSHELGCWITPGFEGMEINI
jgi:ribonuclease BN (tRNA processing enzyme)